MLKFSEILEFGSKLCPAQTVHAEIVRFSQNLFGLILVRFQIRYFAMLSSDLSVFDTVLPTLDDGSKTLILFCVQAVPCLLTPVVLVNINRLANSCRRTSPKVTVERPSPEIRKKAQTVLELKKLSTCRAFIDCASGLSVVFAIFVWIKSSYVGIAAIPAFDLCLMPATLLWLGFVGVYQADVLPQGKHTVTMLSLSYNLVLLYNQVLIRWLEVTDRDSLLLVCRLLAGFAFCDHRKAAMMQIAWIMLKTQTPPHVSNPDNGLNQVWDVLLWEIFRQFVFITPMWLSWFSVEYFVRQFTEPSFMHIRFFPHFFSPCNYCIRQE